MQSHMFPNDRLPCASLARAPYASNNSSQELGAEGGSTRGRKPARAIIWIVVIGLLFTAPPTAAESVDPRPPSLKPSPVKADAPLTRFQQLFLDELLELGTYNQRAVKLASETPGADREIAGFIRAIARGECSRVEDSLAAEAIHILMDLNFELTKTLTRELIADPKTRCHTKEKAGTALAFLVGVDALEPLLVAMEAHPASAMHLLNGIKIAASGGDARVARAVGFVRQLRDKEKDKARRSELDAEIRSLELLLIPRGPPAAPGQPDTRTRQERMTLEEEVFDYTSGDVTSPQWLQRDAPFDPAKVAPGVDQKIAAAVKRRSHAGCRQLHELEVGRSIRHLSTINAGLAKALTQELLADPMVVCEAKQAAGTQLANLLGRDALDPLLAALKAQPGSTEYLLPGIQLAARDGDPRVEQALKFVRQLRENESDAHRRARLEAEARSLELLLIPKARHDGGGGKPAQLR